MDLHHMTSVEHSDLWEELCKLNSHCVTQLRTAEQREVSTYSDSVIYATSRTLAAHEEACRILEEWTQHKAQITESLRYFWTL